MKKKILIALLLFSALTFTGCANDSANINNSSEKESGTKQIGMGQNSNVLIIVVYITIQSQILCISGMELWEVLLTVPLLHRPTTHQTDCPINIIHQQIHWKK